jgi:hypothetical protein
MVEWGQSDLNLCRASMSEVGEGQEDSAPFLWAWFRPASSSAPNRFMQQSECRALRFCPMSYR